MKKLFIFFLILIMTVVIVNAYEEQHTIGGKPVGSSQISTNDSINYIIDGDGAVPATGIVSGNIRIANTCIIQGVYLNGYPSGSINITVSKASYGGSFVYLGSNGIINNTFSQDNILSTWTTNVFGTGNWLQFTVNSVDTLTYATISIDCKR